MYVTACVCIGWDKNNTADKNETACLCFEKASFLKIGSDTIKHENHQTKVVVIICTIKLNR